MKENSSPKNTLPVIFRRSRSSEGAGSSAFVSHPVWIRISAFLSTRSPNTQTTYTGVLKEWCAFLGAKDLSHDAAAKILAATDLHAIAYREWLFKQPGLNPRLKSSAALKGTALPDVRRHGPRPKADGLEATHANATVRKKLAALRRIYQMLVATDVGIGKNPFSVDLVPPPANAGQKRPTEMIDFKLVKRIIETPDAKSAKGVRDRALLALLFGGGLRRSEVLGLRLGDIRKTPAGTTYAVLRATKGRKDANQALPPWAVVYIQKQIVKRKADGGEPGDYLITSYRGRGGTIPTQSPLSSVGLYKLFKFYCLKSGAGIFLSPHSARATAITKLLSSGISYREVQEFSRHGSVQMVELYDKRRIGVDKNPGKDLDYE